MLRNAKGNIRQKHIIESKLKKAERESNRCLPADFIERVHSEIENLDSNLLELKLASLQADPILAKRSVDGISQVIMSNDCDLFVHNPKGILLYTFKYLKRTGTLTNIQLATCHNKTAIFISNCLKNRFINLSTKQLFIDPKIPLFGQEKDPTSRCMIACAIGNDYWIGGQKDFGTTAGMELLNEVSNNQNMMRYHQYLLTFVKTVEYILVYD